MRFPCLVKGSLAFLNLLQFTDFADRMSELHVFFFLLFIDFGQQFGIVIVLQTLFIMYIMVLFKEVFDACTCNLCIKYEQYFKI